METHCHRFQPIVKRDGALIKPACGLCSWCLTHPAVCSQCGESGVPGQGFPSACPASRVGSHRPVRS